MNQALAVTEPDCIRPPVPGVTEVVLVDDFLDWELPDQPGRFVSIHYRLHGPMDAPVVAVLGGISANRQVQCWWRDLYGNERAFDPERARILSLDWIGHGETVSTATQADALAAVLDHLGIHTLAVLVGASYGAMVGLSFGQRHGGRLQRLLAISGADRARPFNTALRHIQREILRLGVETGQSRRAVALARALALTTYRPPSLFDQRFSTDGAADTLAQVSSYLDHVGRCFSDNFSAEHYASLSASLDLHQV
ncbi:MAG: alpha/beta fold hydrolase, partial [Wenzhouxiangella sp.]